MADPSPLSAPSVEAPAGIERLVVAVQDLSLARDIETVTRIVRRAARELSGADGASFVLRDGDRCFYADEDAIAPLWKGLRFPMKSCVSGWVMMNRQALVIEDIYVDPRVPVDAYRPTFVKSLAMVPIRVAQPIGAIGNYWATPHRATTEEVRLLQALADSTSVALENVQLYAELESRVRERTAQLEAANRELEAFSYSVSHDLRAPVRSIQGFSQAVLEDYGEKLDDAGRDYLQRVCGAAQRMDGLIQALLQLSTIARADMHREPVDLGAFAESIVSELREREPERQVELKVSALPASGDPALLRAVMQNLLGNAWKFTGRVERATIEVGRETRDGESVFFVRDNGAGFDPALARKLFAPFQRLHAAKDFPGTGIGLATVQRIVHRHGGRIWAESQPEQGAAIYFTLPVPR